MRKKEEAQWRDTGREFNYIGKSEMGIEVEDVLTGEVFEIPSVLLSSKPLNVSGNKTLWKYEGFP